MAAIDYRLDDIIEIRITATQPVTTLDGLNEVLDSLIKITQDIGAIAELNEDAYGFQLIGIGSDGQALDEPEFFESVGTHPALWDKAAEYVHNITRFNQTGVMFNIAENPYHDEEHEAGRFAIEMLVMEKAKYMADYAEFIWYIDNGHSCIEIEDIQRPIKKWGLCDPALQLLAASFYILYNHPFTNILDGLPVSEYLQKSGSIDDFVLNLYVAGYVRRWKSWPSYLTEMADELIKVLLPNSPIEQQRIQKIVRDRESSHG
nr:hypothetical protein [Armatimonas sp.]